jgi:sugar lactone lactonase YvrE
MKSELYPWKACLALFAASALVFVAVSCSSSTSPTPPSPTTGSIQVNSTPTGAKVYLDGTDTGRTTNTTLANVSAGNHTVKLVKDGYVDHTGSVSVTAGQAATVNATLSKNTITVTAPAAGALLQRNATFDIQWQVGTTMMLRSTEPAPGSPERGLADRLRSPAGRKSDVLADAGGRDLRTQAEDPIAALKPGDRRLAAQPGTAAAAGADPVTTDKGAFALPGAVLRQDAQVVTLGSDTRVLDIADVKIELWKGASKELDIIASTPNDGTHPWIVPASLADGTDYRIRILCATDESVYGDSGAFSIADPESYVFDLKWGSYGAGDGQFFSPHSIAIDGSGYVYVVEHLNDRVQKFTSDGTFVTKWGSTGTDNGQFSFPAGIGVDGAGYLYVADHSNHRVQKFTSDGTFVTKWGSEGSANGQFTYPVGVAVDAAGYIYVAEYSGHRVQKFTSDGTFVTKWGSQGSADGQFTYTLGIAVDSAGYVYVADHFGERVQKFTSDGTFVTKWGSPGSADGQFYRPAGIAVDSAGYVYVVEYGNNRIQKFASDGTFVTKWGSQGSGDGQFSSPMGIAIDSSGYVYVTDFGNNRVQRFRKAN